MEVHPPEHGIHSWRDFLVHMGTICLGLLIAIGLEQGVEALHRQHEARDLREDFRREEEQIVFDGDQSQQYALAHLRWLVEQRKKVMAAVWDDQPMADTVLTAQGVSWDYPYDPIYRTAQSNGRTSVLSRDELYAYSDVAVDVQWGVEYEQALEAAADKRLSFEGGIPLVAPKSGSGALTAFSRVSREDLRKYLELLSLEEAAARRFRTNCLLTRGLADAVARGVRDPKELSAAEAAGVRTGGPSPN